MFDSEIHKRKIEILSRLKEEGSITLEESLLLLNEEEQPITLESKIVDKDIASLLNRLRVPTGTGQQWVQYPTPSYNGNPYFQKPLTFFNQELGGTVVTNSPNTYTTI